MNPNFKKTDWLHSLGVGACFVSIYISGPLSSDIGVSIAIGVVVALSAGSFEVDTDREKIHIVIGSISAGGLRQGQFIKSLLTVALLSSGIIQTINTGNGVSTILLATALGISAVANEAEIRNLYSRIEHSNSDDTTQASQDISHSKDATQKC